MNATKIEWCDMTFNPVTGCIHKCEYCYARRIAERFGKMKCPTNELHILDQPIERITKNGKEVVAAYPFGFEPTFHRYRLDEPLKANKPQSIFVGSMADLFGEWVPDEWIESVFSACEAAPHHRYLFLTKNPSRYVGLTVRGKLPERDNFWYGSTVTGPNVQAFFSNRHHTFISIEPILEPMGGVEGENSLPELAEWAIFGAETGNRAGKVIPERSWIEQAVGEFLKRGKPVFMKNSMIPIWGEDIITEFPWKG